MRQGSKKNRPSSAPKGGLRSALLWAGVASIVVTSTAASRLFLTFGFHVSLVSNVILAVVTLILLLRESRALTMRSLRRLLPVFAFAAVSIVVGIITALRMDGGLPGMLRMSLGPASWMAASVLGYSAGRRSRFPIAVAAGSAWVSALTGLLDLAQRSGLSSPLGALYARWSAAIGAWAPGANEQFRAVGLDVDPNTFGLIGVVALLLALTLEEDARARAAIAVGATSVIALSGSRTAVVASVLALVATGISHVVRRAPWRTVVARSAPAVLGILATALAFSLTAAAAGNVSALGQRFSATGEQALSAASASAGAKGALDAASNGRIEIWKSALWWYSRFPLGSFLLPEFLVGRSIHNEYLERLLNGGPVMLAALVGLLVWLLVKLRPTRAPAFGAALFAAYASAAMTLGVTWMPPFLGMAFYFIGWMAAQKPAPKRETAEAAMTRAA